MHLIFERSDRNRLLRNVPPLVAKGQGRRDNDNVRSCLAKPAYIFRKFYVITNQEPSFETTQIHNKTRRAVGGKNTLLVRAVQKGLAIDLRCSICALAVMIRSGLLLDRQRPTSEKQRFHFCPLMGRRFYSEEKPLQSTSSLLPKGSRT